MLLLPTHRSFCKLIFVLFEALKHTAALTSLKALQNKRIHTLYLVLYGIPELQLRYMSTIIFVIFEINFALHLCG